MYDKTLILRGAFASSLKYCSRYQNKYPELYKTVLKGEKLPREITLLSLAGDYFAYWYTELKLPVDKYNETAMEFFTVCWPKGE